MRKYVTRLRYEEWKWPEDTADIVPDKLLSKVLSQIPMLNDDKTEFVLIGTRQQLAKVDIVFQ